MNYDFDQMQVVDINSDEDKIRSSDFQNPSMTFKGENCKHFEVSFSNVALQFKPDHQLAN